jgi:hypothetical protein
MPITGMQTLMADMASGPTKFATIIESIMAANWIATAENTEAIKNLLRARLMRNGLR